MKKLLSISLIFGLVAIYFSEALAQNRGGWGAAAGVNFANINDDPNFDTTSRTGLMLGINYQFLLGGGPLYLQPELSYSQKGYEGASGETMFKFNYLVVSALASYYFTSVKALTPFLKAGPSLSFKTSSKVEYDDGDKQDVEGVKDTDVGVTLRAGVQIKRIEVGAHLSQSVTKLVDGDDEFGAKIFLFGLFVGFNF